MRGSRDSRKSGIRLPRRWCGSRLFGAPFLSSTFFALLFQGAFHSPLLSRYCAGHPIEIIELTVFFVGLAALMLRFCEVFGQFPSLRGRLLPRDSDGRAAS